MLLPLASATSVESFDIEEVRLGPGDTLEVVMTTSREARDNGVMLELRGPFDAFQYWHDCEDIPPPPGVHDITCTILVPDRWPTGDYHVHQILIGGDRFSPDPAQGTFSIESDHQDLHGPESHAMHVDAGPYRPGDTVDIAVTLYDEVGVHPASTLMIRSPGGASFDLPCDVPAASGRVTLHCHWNVTSSDVNGRYTATINARDLNGIRGRWASVEGGPSEWLFNVTGAVQDNEPPVLAAVEPVQPRVWAESEFGFRFHVQDDSELAGLDFEVRSAEVSTYRSFEVMFGHIEDCEHAAGVWECSKPLESGFPPGELYLHGLRLTDEWGNTRATSSDGRDLEGGSIEVLSSFVRVASILPAYHAGERAAWIMEVGIPDKELHVSIDPGALEAVCRGEQGRFLCTVDLPPDAANGTYAITSMLWSGAPAWNEQRPVFEVVPGMDEPHEAIPLGWIVTCLAVLAAARLRRS